MKKIIYGLMVMILSLTSCTDDVLDKQPLDMISDAVVWNDPALIDAYLANVYNEMGFIMEMDYLASRGWFGHSYTVVMADEACPGWENGKHVNILNTGSSASWGQWWGYPTVRKINEFLEKIAKSPVDEAIKKQRIAEARFLRAFAYFKMVERYGGVPLITKVQQLNDTEEELYRKRDKEQVIYDFILSEIDAVINDLLDTGKNEKGRPSKAAALALKSRTAMFAASVAQWGKVQLDGIVGIPADKAVSYWQKSYDASKAIIAMGKFSLYKKHADKSLNYRNLFLDENNSEVIFSEIYNGTAGKAHSWDHFNSVLGFNAWGAGAQACAYLEMVEDFENIDGSDPKLDRNKIENKYLWTVEEMFGKKEPRFKAMIITQDDYWKGKKLDKHKGIRKEDGTITQDDYKNTPAWGFSTRDSDTNTPFQTLKYMDESIAIVPGTSTSATDYMVFRYAETLINLAEAAFELNKQSEALDAVNQVRERAGLNPLTSVTRDLIRHERKIEFAFEGTRYFDVRRWRTAVVDLSVQFTGMNIILDYATGKYQLELLPNFEADYAPVFNERHYYLPITLARIANNKNLVENPGYN